MTDAKSYLEEIEAAEINGLGHDSADMRVICLFGHVT
jgi:hypothetical protein